MVTCRIILKIYFIIFIGFFISACSNPTLYQWGKYEDLLYKRYVKPGSISPQEEISALELQLEKTYSKELLPPPGLHAHLAYLYISDGQYSRALEHFQAEKKLFPASEHFINGLIDRMKK